MKLAELLFQSSRIGALELRNRIVMAPMTRSFSPGGVPGEDVAAYYGRRAENDVGLIVTEGTVIGHPASANDFDVPRLFGEEALAGWQRVTAAVHAAGGRIAAQLWHVGSVRKPADSPNPDVLSISPSGLRKAGTRYGDPITAAEIGTVIEAYGRAADAARQVGFDAIEIHGGHGYLIDQFLWSATNERTDCYGGSVGERTRFATEVIRACRRVVGPAFPILFRFSQWKLQDYAARLAHTPEELSALLTPIVTAGVDALHCSTRRFWEPEFDGSQLTLAGWAKRLTGVPVITVGSIGLDLDSPLPEADGEEQMTRADRLTALIDRGEIDLIAVGRALLADPQWARKLREGRLGDVRPFTNEAAKVLY